MRFSKSLSFLSAGTLLSCLLLSAVYAMAPAEKFDLRFWKLEVPLDGNNDGKVDQIDVQELGKYSHPDFFFLDEDGFLVFSAPNKAVTTPNSTNTRSELRQMYRSKNTKIGTHDAKNNFALQAHRRARTFADIGGQMEATLKVLHVARNAKHADKKPAFSVVIGQIHADKNEDVIKKGRGFGWGNEPIKIYYKKWPQHDTGSVFWTYERNLASDNPDRTDIAYPVWGNTWENPDDPGENGIALGQLFNYNINVHGNIMYLTFRTTDASQTVNYEIDLSNNVDAYGKVDEKDNPNGYSGDAMYFKAGAYNQCSAKDDPAFWYPACAGSGDWETDKANGDYVSVAFRRLQLTRSVKPRE